MNKLLLTIALLFVAAFIFGRLDDDVRIIASGMAVGAIFTFPFGWLRGAQSRRHADFYTSTYHFDTESVDDGD